MKSFYFEIRVDEGWYLQSVSKKLKFLIEYLGSPPNIFAFQLELLPHIGIVEIKVLHLIFEDHFHQLFISVRFSSIISYGSLMFCFGEWN